MPGSVAYGGIVVSVMLCCVFSLGNRKALHVSS